MKNLTLTLLLILTLVITACGGSAPTTDIPQPAPAETQPENAVNMEAPVLTTLPRITDAQVMTIAVQLRQGPAAQCSQLGVVHRGQLVDVLAVNPGQNWLLIDNAGMLGWVPVDDMALIGSVDDLPVVEPATLQLQQPWQEVNVGKSCLA